ncbi:unnamed protein product, partial [Porites lobata]
QLNKWHSETNNPAFVIYLRGGAVLCEGYTSPNWGKPEYDPHGGQSTYRTFPRQVEVRHYHFCITLA